MNEEIFASTEGKLFSWGDNTYGQLGIGSQVTTFTGRPTEVTSLRSVPLVRIACGGWHSFALTISGSVFGWGKNDFGQLGLGNRERRSFIFHMLLNSSIYDGFVPKTKK